MITGVHHFAIIVSSEENVEFYTKLGFYETYRRKRCYDTVVLMLGQSIQIEIFIDPSHPKRDVPEPLGIRHVAFQVDDIQRTLNELNVEVPINKDWLGKTYCNINDPDGNVIELHE